jgi:hypothetical protein
MCAGVAATKIAAARSAAVYAAVYSQLNGRTSILIGNPEVLPPVPAASSHSADCLGTHP